MKKIGILFGEENGVPGALVECINARNQKGIVAEFVQVGAVSADRPSDYTVLVDRISHEVPFYRAWLKQAALQGVSILNDPFRASVSDRFLNGIVAARAGVAVPPTVLLPHKQHPGRTSAGSLRNLEYPLDWEGVFATVGEHGYLKPIHGGNQDVYEVHSRDEFFAAYDASGTHGMIYQQAVPCTAYFRCYVVGQKKVRVMACDPHRPHQERSLSDSAPEVGKPLLKRIEQDAIRLSTALGYDVNCVEFAVQDEALYAVDFTNPVPDADENSVGAEHHEWFVHAVADLAIARAKAAHGSPASTWFDPAAPVAEAAAPEAPQAAPKKAARKRAGK